MFLPLQTRFGLHGSCLKSKENKRLERIGPRTSTSVVAWSKVVLHPGRDSSSSGICSSTTHSSDSWVRHSWSHSQVRGLFIRHDKDWEFVFFSNVGKVSTRLDTFFPDSLFHLGWVWFDLGWVQNWILRRMVPSDQGLTDRKVPDNPEIPVFLTHPGGISCPDSLFHLGWVWFDLGWVQNRILRRMVRPKKWFFGLKIPQLSQYE